LKKKVKLLYAVDYFIFIFRIKGLPNSSRLERTSPALHNMIFHHLHGPPISGSMEPVESESAKLWLIRVVFLAASGRWRWGRHAQAIQRNAQTIPRCQAGHGQQVNLDSETVREKGQSYVGIILLGGGEEG
jgi:hypothetical protein